MPGDKILFVDDEQNLLDGIRREFGLSYNIALALGGIEGIRAVETKGPFAVIVSDMRMPDIDGVKFLQIVKKLAPDSVRIMLTGNADLDTAINAVNEGNIFRFITKPCSSETLEKTLNASVKQYHLIEAEHELLQKTLQGGIRVLVDILSLTNPIAFSKAKRIQFFAGELAKALDLDNIWRIECAAMFSQIGCVTIPPDTLLKIYTNQNLSPDEQKMLHTHPRLAHDLIVNIPRLEEVAEIIAHQQEDFCQKDRKEALDISDSIASGSAILHLAIDFDSLLSRGLSRGEALKELNRNAKAYHPKLLDILKKITPPSIEKQVSMIKIRELRLGMTLERDIQTKKGLLLAQKGQEITTTVCLMLENYYKRGNIEDQILVSLPLNYSQKKENSYANL